jgi:hypothetical protein
MKSKGDLAAVFFFLDQRRNKERTPRTAVVSPIVLVAFLYTVSFLPHVANGFGFLLHVCM